MDLTIYNIILGPVVSEKASRLINENKKVMLKVHPDANKPMIAEALKKLFDVQVKNIRIIVRKGKQKTVRRVLVTGILRKYAIITLKDAESFDKLISAGAGATPEVGQSMASEASN